MSGALSSLGFGSDWLLSLQKAVWRGVPFSVVADQVQIGRKAAVHEYPFRDGVWVEDMGRAPRRFSFSGYLTGSLAPALAEVIKTQSERPGPGILVHPSLGAMNVSLISAAFGERRERMRVIEVAFEFIEQGEPLYFSNIIGAALNVLTFSNITRTAATGSFQANAVAPLASGPLVVSGGVATVTAFGAMATGAANDPAAASRAVAALPGNLGRFSAGATSIPAADDATVASLIADVTTARATLATAVAAVIAEFAVITVTTDVGALIDAVLAALVLAIPDPAERVRVLLDLSGFAATTGSTGVGLADDIASFQGITASLCRRIVIAGLADAVASYQPSSYQDAIALRGRTVAAIDVETVAAADAGDDSVYAALRDLRSAVVSDLAGRGADLASVATVQFGAPLPSLVVAYRLYADTARSDDVTARAMPVHPAFLPISFEALSR